MKFAAITTGALLISLMAAFQLAGAAEPARPHIKVRGIYGGLPVELLAQGKSLRDYGVNAIWFGSGGLSREKIAQTRQQGARVFAEFNTMHEAGYLKANPDAAPIGPDGLVSPPPSGWQGICPTHPGYRKSRMEVFRTALRDFEIDGIWLDYHHSHASWEQAKPELPDTCFCPRCLKLFSESKGIRLPAGSPAEVARFLLGERKKEWVDWRCGVFTDWVREFSEVRDVARPAALLGTFHCPWSDTDYNGALREKLAIDLNSQARYIDVFSPMPYHARFGHASDPAWISRQTLWLERHLAKTPSRRGSLEIWPIVQLADWGEKVPASQVREVLEHGTRRPATGVMVFAWGRLREQPESVEEMGKFYRSISGE